MLPEVRLQTYLDIRTKTIYDQNPHIDRSSLSD
jgi:hypothetical protein